MIKLFNEKVDCEQLELPTAKEIVAEMDRMKLQRVKERRGNLIFLIRETAKDGCYECTAELKEEDIAWLVAAGYKISSWGNGRYEISWRQYNV